MTLSPSSYRPFQTVFGRNLLEEVPNFVAPPYVIVTMSDLWPRLHDRLPADTRVHVVTSLERRDLEAQLAAFEGVASVIGLGGGQAIDVAKYVAWRKNLRLFQFPTALTVDAMYGQRAGVRENGIVRYVGWAVPEAVYWDHALLDLAPPHLNRAGVGDVFCFFTGVWDWEYSHRLGQCEARWPFDDGLAAESLGRAEAALAGADDIRDLTARGIRLIVEGFQWGGASFHAAGWCPRHIEGVEHYIFYALEARTGVKFLHGQAVCLGIVTGAMMHGRRVDELTAAIHRIGVDMRPESMGIGWDDVDATLRDLAAFVRREGMPHGIAHDFAVDAAFLADLRRRVEAGG